MKRRGLSGSLMVALLTAATALAYSAVQPTGGSQEDAFAGLPRASSHSPSVWVRVLHNEGFVIGYSEIRRDPLWVSYRARPITHRHYYRRPENFDIDKRTLSRVSPSAYSGSGYQRGHMAPNYIISELYGRRAQSETFLMSNVTPQRPNLNEKLWQRLEEAEADHFTRWFTSLWVTAGPVFGEHGRRLRGGVEVPEAFYRLFVGVDGDGNPHMLAFIMPQAVMGNEPLDRFLTTVDEVEARTGLDFFSDLPDDQEDKMESGPADASWHGLKKVSRLTSRY